MLSDRSSLDESTRLAVFGFLSHLTTDELKSVLNDDAKLDEILKDVKQSNDRETEKELLLAENRSLAEYNLSKEPSLTSYKNEILQISEEGEELYQKVSEKYERLSSLMGQNKLDAMLSILQLATSEVEQESEKIADKFVSGESDVEDFLEHFISRRKQMYLNKVKADKMSEMIRQRGSINSINNQNMWNHSNHISPVSINGYPSSMPGMH